ncbi:hypothetical protein AC26_4195 [Escherichia coli 1-176-05_S3_C2]|nr:hypothetical protein AC26_4195 [Escherichia coli 1-176-05_S3_C2]
MEVTCHAGVGCRNGNLRPEQAAGVKLCGLFRKKNATAASR